MKIFKEFYKEWENQRDKDRVALMPGGYKPPTKGHFSAFLYLLEDADKGVVFIGNKERDGITAEQSKAIWDIYAKYTNKPVEVVIAPISPVKSVYDYVDENKDIEVVVGAGDKDEDIKRYSYFEKNADKYPFVSITKIPLQEEGISGTKTRNLIATNIDEAINYFVPNIITNTDTEAIKDILTT